MTMAERLDYDQSDFEYIRAMMHEIAGISLHDGKKELVYSRLAKRLRNLGVSSFSDYVEMLKSDSEEAYHCINFLTTNVTSFFRERHHFDFIRQNLFDNAGSRPIRIWSAGCATGEEPYSIAFTADDYPGLNVSITATDLDTEVVQRARSGVYKERTVTDLTTTEKKRWFEKGAGAKKGLVRVVAPYRNQIRFSSLNLKQPFEFDQPFDAVFCRNVMIYFDNKLRAELLDRFARVIKPNGFLFLGHSESMLGLNNSFKVVGKTIHQKVAVS